MVDAKRLLADLKRLRRNLDADLREHHAASPQRDAVHAEWQAALAAKRTADTFEPFWSAALDQAAVHWILAIVFIRFLEDNRLLDRPLLSGPGERLDLAAERQRAYVRQKPLDTDTDYLLASFAEAATLPGLAGLYDPAHNPLFRLPPSGDGAIALLEFFRARVPETGALLHDFTDPAWNTRFLGDLYQDLSEDARKRYALLQTPEFVEEWILDRTLDPAMREFGGTKVRMIDPACGSGHFLLGGFSRVLAAWQREAPDMPPAAQAQRALDAVSGVDLNPFAVEIARFRLLLAALQAAEVTRLTAAPAFRFSLAVGDSLLHGRHFGQQRDFALEVDEGFGRTLRHHYAAEDTGELEAILGRQYHAVVGNPPYITPKDRAMREAYREIYASCHMKYALTVPFTERFFELAQVGKPNQIPGFVGLIVANSFMKREFGKKLIQNILPSLDLTHVVDCSGAYIPGNGTPSAILLGRNRPPLAGTVRMVVGLRGEPGPPENPATAFVWSAIRGQTDLPGSANEFVSVSDEPRSALGQHPWTIGGEGERRLKAHLESYAPLRLQNSSNAIGFGAILGIDDAFEFRRGDLSRLGITKAFERRLIIGDYVGDWHIASESTVFFPYDDDLDPILPPEASPIYWLLREVLSARNDFSGKTYREAGRAFFEYHQFPTERYRAKGSIVFPFVATHASFCYDESDAIYNKTSPIIKLRDTNQGTDLAALLNSSVASFWMKQVFFNKGAGGGTRVEAGRSPLGDENWENHYEHDGTKLARLPVARELPTAKGERLSQLGRDLLSNTPAAGQMTEAAISERHHAYESARTQMISEQEELDWACYRLYGILDDAPEHQSPPPLHLGERAFEIVMARHMTAGTLETTWFVRHGSVPITELPGRWPADYRAVVERRIELIETDSTIRLLEQPEYKRRWSAESWQAQEQRALRDWLLDRLEDPRYWPAAELRLISTHALADATRSDADFLSVAALYAGDTAFNLEALVAELVTRESVPFLALLRYSETGLRKRADWEATWDKQRQEDRIDAEVARQMREKPAQPASQHAGSAAGFALGGNIVDAGAEPRHDAADADDAALQRAIERAARQRKQQEVGTIPVPPKYKQADFRSADFWRLRGGLDVPKERFVSFPHCARDADGSLPVLWAGADHLARANAIAAWYVERKDTDGWLAPRLVPLLAGLLELVPWLRQWHNDIDPATGLRMGDYFSDFIEEECRTLGLTAAELRDWQPPAPTRRPRGRKPRN